MIWELQQQSKIASAEEKAQRAISKADRYAQDIADLKRHSERLSLACQAMWELVRERTGLTEDEIETKILEIDARDGRIDRKIATRQLVCPSCGKPTNSRRTTCVLCGVPLPREHQFEV